MSKGSLKCVFDGVRKVNCPKDIWWASRGCLRVVSDTPSWDRSSVESQQRTS